MGRQQTKAQRALAIGRKIGELEAEARPIMQAIAELKIEHALLFPEEDERDEAPTAKPKKKKQADQNAPREWKSLGTRILDFFESRGGEQADLDAVADGLGVTNRQS